LILPGIPAIPLPKLNPEVMVSYVPAAPIDPKSLPKLSIEVFDSIDLLPRIKFPLYYF